MDETKADLRTGAVLNGRYRIVELLGEGGMGLVYRGERLQLGRPVAIKFLHTPYAKSAKFVARFEREARAMSQLSHPHCVSVIDFGMHDAPYIVMDYVTGVTLREALDRGPMAVPKALSIVRQVLLGLAHAHELGIVHRDIKPGNIMLASATGMDDQVRIFDFGLAKLAQTDGEADSSTASVVGTPAYMAPEQASAGRVDARADLYAAGIVLFEMLAGHKPFQGDDAFTVLCMQRDSLPPRLVELKPELSLALCQAVDKALAKDPAARFQSATEFIAALDAVPETRTPSQPDLSLRDDPLGLAATVLVEPGLPPLRSSQAGLAVAAQTPGDSSVSGAEPIAPTATRPRGRRPRAVLLTGFALAAGAFAAGGYVALRQGWFGLDGQGQAPGSEASAPAPVAAPEAAVYAASSQAVAHAPEPAALPALEPPATAPAQDPAAAGPGAAEAPTEPAAVEPAAPAMPPPEPPPSTAPVTPAAAPNAADELSEAQLAAADRALDVDERDEPPLSVSPTPRPSVRTAAAARALARAGHVEDAIAALRELRRKNPKSAELPTAIGDLYFERGWWSDALAKYREAIRLDGRYRRRDSIQRNAIRALDDNRTYGRARALLVKDIGWSAGPKLRKAAKSGSTRTLKSRAASVLAALR